MSKKYGLGVNSTVAKLKAWSFDLGFQLFNKKMLSVMSKATNDYVKKLEPLPELARAEDRTFFEYVIAQEHAQAVALKHADAGNFDLGTAALDDFLAEQEESRSTLQ